MQTTPGSNSGFVLLVERGQTQFPERPIDGDRFLIGGGSNCQLQLGGEIPLLHSIIVPEGDHLWIDAVVPMPPLVVNGQTVRETELRQGDLIEIGTFVFCVGRSPRKPVASAISQPAESLPSSANDLVDALRREIETLDGLERQGQQGAAALLQAATQLPPSSPVADSPSFPGEVERLLQELRLRSEQLDHREAALAEHARQLERTQVELQKQLQQVCEQIEAPASESPSSLRLTA